MTLLVLRGVTKRFGGLVAVDDVTVSVPAGGITAVIGPNGAGKSTLFNVISGFCAPDSGQVMFDGKEITGMPPERIAAHGLARTFQLVQLFGDLTAFENIKVGCHLHTSGGLLAAVLRLPRTQKSEKAVEETARRLLDFVGLSDCANTQAANLPYGHQRLLEIARALATRPKLLLLDEPAAGLNSAETARLSDTIRRIAAEGSKVLLIEHDMKLVMNAANRIVVLDFGRKIAEGTPDEVRRDPAVLAAYLGTVGAQRG